MGFRMDNYYGGIQASAIADSHRMEALRCEIAALQADNKRKTDALKAIHAKVAANRHYCRACEEADELAIGGL